MLGAPLNLDTYDYKGAVTWNAMAPELWAKTMDLLTKQLARLAGYSQRTFVQVGRRSFGKVAEVQARGLAHYHAVIRLDGINPDDHHAVIPPGSWASVDLLERAIRAAVAQAVVIAPDGTEIHWGDQLDIRPIVSLGTDHELTEEAVAGYIAKYATKSAECTGTVDRPLYCCACHGTGQIETRHATIDCADCVGTGSTADLDALPVSDHARRMIQTCWRLGRQPQLAGVRLRQCAHTLGYGGHFSTKSRRYSTTLTALRGARQNHETVRLLHVLGLDPAVPVMRASPAGGEETNDESVLVIGNWRYAGRSHRAGEACWAAAIAEDIAHNRKVARWAQAEQAAAEAELWRRSDRRGTARERCDFLRPAKGGRGDEREQEAASGSVGPAAESSSLRRTSRPTSNGTESSLPSDCSSLIHPR
jgi:hypothetical protein